MMYFTKDEIFLGIVGRERGNKYKSRRDELNFNQHIAVFNLQRIHGDLGAWILFGSAGLRIVRPAMPGTDHLATFDHSLPQRAAAVQADVVHGADRAVYVGYANGFCTAGKFFGFVGGWEFGFGGELRELGHIGLRELAKEA